MFWLYALFLFLLASSAAVSIFLLARLWRLRAQPGTWGLFVSTLAVAVWAFFYILEIVLPEPPQKVLAAQMQFLGITPIPVGIFWFAFHYTGAGRRLPRYALPLLALIPALTLLLVFTFPSHAVFWRSAVLAGGRAFAPLEIDHGWFFGLFVAYAYILLTISLVLTAWMALTSPGLYRAQALWMMVALLAPWAGNALYVSGLVQVVDVTPLMFTITNLGLLAALTRYGLLAVLPVAYPTVLQAMQDGVIVLDGQGRIVEINRAAAQILRPGPAYLGQQVSYALPILAEWLAGLNLDAPDEKEVSLVANGQTRYYSLRAAPARSSLHIVTGRVVIIRDITEQKRALRRLLLQATAMEAASNAIVITDARGLIQWVNPAFTRLTGYSAAEALGQSVRLLRSGAHPEEYYQRMWETITAGQVWHGVITNRRKDGSLYDEEMSITPILDEAGRPEYYVAIKQDVTDRRAAEDQLKAAHREALEASRLKSQLLANVSHELRTPLGTVIGYVEMLKAGYYGELTNEQRGILDEIATNSNQLLEFVNNLLSQAQVETGKVILHNQLFTPTALIDAARHTSLSAARRRGLTLETEVDPNLPATLTGDPFWLQQMIQNLVNNAIKFTEQGMVKIRCYQASSQEWAIEVSDTGMGIPSEAQDRIFEPFTQANGSVTRRHGGTGLGLSIVRELVRLMGGSIRLQSTVGQGSSFTILLPILPAAEEE